MRHVFRSTALAALLVLLAGCGASRDEAGAAAAANEQRVLHVYNWADYVGETTIADFEARTGIKVTYDVFDSVEMLMTKLLTGGSGYDIVVPNGGGTYRLLPSGALRKLDRTKLKNLANLDPRIMAIVAANDPGNETACLISGGRRASATTPSSSRRRWAPALSTACRPCSTLRWLRSSQDAESRCWIPDRHVLDRTDLPRPRRRTATDL